MAEDSPPVVPDAILGPSHVSGEDAKDGRRARGAESPEHAQAEPLIQNLAWGSRPTGCQVEPPSRATLGPKSQARPGGILAEEGQPGLLGPIVPSPASPNGGGRVEPGGWVPSLAGGVGDSPAPAKPSLKERRLALVAKVDEKVRRRAQRVEAANGLAAYIDDAGNPLPGVPVDLETGRPKGWSAVTHQIAKDSRRPIKVQPGYIAQQLRVAESYRKAESEKPTAPTINAELVQISVQQFNYPVRKVTED